ncbi:MAG: hypothetical protein RL701_7289 [Pseudomonadota bacterium]
MVGICAPLQWVSLQVSTLLRVPLPYVCIGYIQSYECLIRIVVVTLATR